MISLSGLLSPASVEESYMLPEEQEELIRGEDLKVIEDYDLFGNNLRNNVGVYLKTDPSSKKCLIYFFDFDEWAELELSFVERVKPGFLSTKNKEFISRVKPLEYSYPT